MPSSSGLRCRPSVPPSVPASCDGPRLRPGRDLLLRRPRGRALLRHGRGLRRLDLRRGGGRARSHRRSRRRGAAGELGEPLLLLGRSHHEGRLAAALPRLVVAAVEELGRHRAPHHQLPALVLAPDLDVHRVAPPGLEAPVDHAAAHRHHVAGPDDLHEPCTEAPDPGPAQPVGHQLAQEAHGEHPRDEDAGEAGVPREGLVHVERAVVPGGPAEAGDLGAIHRRLHQRRELVADLDRLEVELPCQEHRVLLPSRAAGCRSRACGRRTRPRLRAPRSRGSGRRWRRWSRRAPGRRPPSFSP